MWRGGSHCSSGGLILTADQAGLELMAILSPLLQSSWIMGMEHCIPVLSLRWHPEGTPGSVPDCVSPVHDLQNGF